MRHAGIFIGFAVEEEEESLSGVDYGRWELWGVQPYRFRSGTSSKLWGRHMFAGASMLQVWIRPMIRCMLGLSNALTDGVLISYGVTSWLV
jgi:hypothetical protein